MYKMSVKLENVANLEKRLNSYVGNLELVPQLQQNLQDIRDQQLPQLVDELRKQMVSKIESAMGL